MKRRNKKGNVSIRDGYQEGGREGGRGAIGDEYQKGVNRWKEEGVDGIVSMIGKKINVP
jgi:hypothetical protein